MLVTLLFVGVPRDLDYHNIKDSLQHVKGVKAVHSLTVWCLTLEKNALAVHLAAGRLKMLSIYGLRHSKTCLQEYADRESPDQPAHLCRLIWAFPCLLTELLDTVEHIDV